MKRTLRSFLFLFLWGTIGAKAQSPVITATGVNPQIGEKFKLYQTHVNSVTLPDSGGTNKIWDYSNLKDSAFISISVVSPKGLLYSDSFPTSNLALQIDMDTLREIEYDKTSSECWGVVGQLPPINDTNYIELDFNRPIQKNILYPMTFKEVYTDTISVASSIYHHGTCESFFPGPRWDTLYADSYGTLKLPNATYTNVLRVYSGSGFEGAGDYYYYVNGVHWPILMLLSNVYNTNVDNNNDVYWQAIYYGGSLLPIEISSFTASLQNKMPYLKWDAVNTENTKAFNIQRSIDGRSFSTVGQIGANQGFTYHFEDNYKPSSSVYYRLQQVDKDGQTFYSNIVLLTVSNKQFSISPNPAKDYATISFSNTVDNATIFVYDNTGKEVLAHSLSGNANSYKLNIQTLKSGVYVVKVNTATGSYNEKLLINK